MENVDIIDRKNNVLYQTSKEEAHIQGLLHRTVIAEVIDNKGRMLLVKQAGHKQDAGQFVSPVGGHVRVGESELEALRREAEEELGIKSFIHKYLGRVVYNRTILGRHENHLFIVYELTTDEEPRLNDESVEYQWFTKENLRQLLKKSRQQFGPPLFFVVKHFYQDLLI